METMEVGGVARFGPFELDLGRQELRRQGEAVAIQPQPLRALSLLVAQQGRLVSRRDLQSSLWGDSSFLDVDRSLNHTIRKLRMVLDDDARSPQFIQTVPRRGYRFIGKTIEVGGDAMASVGSSTSQLILAAPASGEPARVIVQPFRDIVGEGGWPRLSEGVVEELITELVRLQPRVWVIDASIGGDPEIDEAASASYVLRGAIRQAGPTVRVHAHLVQGGDGRLVGTTVFDHNFEGLFALQQQIARRIVEALVKPLVP